jgi:hypothetical protein
MDLMTYLLEVWGKHINEHNVKLAGCDDPIGEFARFCQKHLTINPPKSVFMAQYGVGLRLTDGTEVPVTVQPDEAATAASASMPIFGAGNYRKNDMQGTGCINIFGGK